MCFSNVSASALLNIPKFRDIFKTYKTEIKGNVSENKILCELIRLYEMENFSQLSTENLRSIVYHMCIESDEKAQTFIDKKQHDAAEFLSSVLEHTFKDLPVLQCFKEKLFGGLWQTTLTCNDCMKIETSEIENMPDIVPLEIIGEKLEECLDNFFRSEVVERNCPQCHSVLAIKQI